MVGAGCACLMMRPEAARSQTAYFNAEFGPALADDVDFKQYFGPISGAKQGLDTGVRFGFSAGCNFNQYLAVEAETGFIYNSFSDVDGSVSHIPMMANAVVRYDTKRSKWVPYAGAGLGGDVSIISLNNVEGNGVIADGSEATVVFAWQAFAGLRYKINKEMSFGAGYKYYSADPASWDFAGYSDSIKIGRANIHSILFEFSMKF